ncbi:hypothetical protein BD413DRAFT_603832 [Trametes elegans]|nr:hypothetical protein BD413DRAFT_603832 [Trametes elegans]
MTPHGLPPITPSMPSFTFLPQPSPGLPSPAAVEPDRPTMHGHMQHVMTPFSPFSPGVTMSPGAFWGRPGTGANPFINPAVGAPVRPGHPYYGAYPQQYPTPTPPLLQQGQQPEGSGQEGGRPPDGYFPPVAVSVAMAQGGAVARDEPAGYFPWMPPAAHGGEGAQAQHRTSGLANEILREDSASASASGSSGAGVGAGVGVEPSKESPSASEGTATTAGTGMTGTTGRSAGSSSRGTSWHTDAELELEGAVEDALGGSPGAELGVNGHGAHGQNGHGKPRAYSAETGASSGTERGGLHRADSDPVRKVLGEQRAAS